MSAPIVAVDMKRASTLSGIPQSTLRDWEAHGIFKPTFIDPRPRVPFRRIYSFRDLVSLRALYQIRKQQRVSLDEVRRAGSYLRRYYESPWSELSFGTVGRRLVFRDPVSKKWIGSDGQHVLELDLKGIPHEIERSLPSLTHRDPSHFGKVVRNRYVHHNQTIISGTRIPTATIWAFHQDGYSVQDILREYPHLTTHDVEAAIAFERQIQNAA